jgi:hypothetical protein
VVGNHAIGGHNGVAFEAVRPNHKANDSGVGGVRHFAVAAAVPAVVPWASSGRVPKRPGPQRGMRKTFALSPPNAYLEFKREFEKGPA